MNDETLPLDLVAYISKLAKNQSDFADYVLEQDHEEFGVTMFTFLQVLGAGILLSGLLNGPTRVIAGLSFTLIGLTSFYYIRRSRKLIKAEEERQKVTHKEETETLKNLLARVRSQYGETEDAEE